MGLFKPYGPKPEQGGSAPGTAPGKAKVTAAPTAPAPATGQTAKTPGKKSIPTPTRRQAEQARRDRIQPVITRKEARLKDREAKYKSRDEAMAKVHNKGYNTLMRDWVDRRWNLGEFALPGMLLIFLLMTVGTAVLPVMTLAAPYIMGGAMLLVILDMVLMWRGARQQLMTYFPDEPLKGKLSYAISRAMLMRRSRIPPPRVKRGTPFVWPRVDDDR